MSNRKSFVFPPEAAARLDQLSRACRVTSASSVVRLALLVLEDLIRALAQGQRIVLVSRDGTQTTYHPLLDQNGRPEQISLSRE